MMAHQASFTVRRFHHRNASATTIAPIAVSMNTPMTIAHCVGVRPTVNFRMGRDDAPAPIRRETTYLNQWRANNRLRESIATSRGGEMFRSMGAA